MRIIISGIQGAGKTTRIAEICRQLASRYSIGGVITTGSWENGIRSGYQLVNVATGETHPFAETNNFSQAIRLGRYFVHPSALEFGLQAISDASQSDCLVIDEVGHWELNSYGWAPALNSLSQQNYWEVWGVGMKNLSAVQYRWPRDKEIVIAPDQQFNILRTS